MRHFLTLFDLTQDEIVMLLQEAARMKTVQVRGQRSTVLAGKVLGMVFEKPSLRTRVSFETAMAHLGGSSIFLPGSETGLGSREPIPDFARTLSQYVDCAVLRTFRQDTIETFAAHSTCPVINGLSDYDHPCQALGDLLTVQEVFGQVTGKTLAFVGDGNNVARSLAVACGKLGMRFILAAPDGYGFDEPFLRKYEQMQPVGELVLNGKPGHAVQDADVIYTDVWASMGQEAERDQRKKSFADFQVNAALLKQAPKHARLMHCLPAKREEEVTSDVLDSERSVVFQQAGNRMHAQKALLKWLMKLEAPMPFRINLGGEGEVPGVLNQQGPWVVLQSGWCSSRTVLTFEELVRAGHSFLICDNLSLPLPDGCVDEVITDSVPIDWVTHLGPGVQTSEVQRILKSGGRWIHDTTLRWVKP